MGLLLSNEEKVDIRSALESEMPCSSYLGAKLDAQSWAGIFCPSTRHDKDAVKVIFEDIKLWIELFPRSNNIPNLLAFTARLYELLCEDNNLSRLGVKMILDKTLQSRKQIPSISEIVSDLELIKEKYLEFRESYNELMRLYQHTVQKLIKQLKDKNLSEPLSDILDIKQLIHAWSVALPFDPFPGCDVRSGSADKNFDLVVDAISKPRHENPLLMFFLIVIETVKKNKIDQFHTQDLSELVAELFPNVPRTHNEKPCCVDDITDLILGLINPARSQTEETNYIRKITYNYFQLDAMLE